jgi:hypothetical protein
MALLNSTEGRKWRVPRAGLVALIAGLVTMGPAPARAAQANHFRIEILDSFVDDYWSDTCGTEVVISIDGTLNVTRVYNQASLIVEEIDSWGGVTVTYSAPETGDSFSYPSGSNIIDFGAGAEIGSTFTMKLVGVIGEVPGYASSSAGLIIVSGTVTGFDEYGSPELEVTDLLADLGNRNSFDDVTAAVCSALTA